MPRFTVSEQLRNALKASIRDQADIARDAGIDPAALSRFLNNGKRRITSDTLDKLCSYLKLELRPIGRVPSTGGTNEKDDTTRSQPLETDSS